MGNCDRSYSAEQCAVCHPDATRPYALERRFQEQAPRVRIPQASSWSYRVHRLVSEPNPRSVSRTSLLLWSHISPSSSIPLIEINSSIMYHSGHHKLMYHCKPCN